MSPLGCRECGRLKCLCILSFTCGLRMGEALGLKRSDINLDAGTLGVNRHFKPLLRRSGLPEVRWHDLRHSCFTILLARGTHPKYVQHLAEHVSIQLTLDGYSHWMPSLGRNTADGMDEALG